jgi:hypothetical protein
MQVSGAGFVENQSHETSIVANQSEILTILDLTVDQKSDSTGSFWDFGQGVDDFRVRKRISGVFQGHSDDFWCRFKHFGHWNG